ncbi:MAG: hypothetical protein P9M14_14505 [Candidatus Alcyoniella australis]|nr:hypothetical protein [Candidatus Alcyoniella australis]
MPSRRQFYPGPAVLCLVMRNSLDFLTNPPPGLAAAIQAARELGLEAHLVGGAVRDLLLGREPIDFDIMLERDADQAARRCAELLGGSVVVVNRRFSTARVVRGRLAPVDLLDRQGGLDQDLGLRDFTANAMAWRLAPQLDRRPVDPFDGERDARQGLVRAVGPHSVIDQPIRALRAFRLMALFGPQAQIEPQTVEQLQSAAPGLPQEPGETAGRELFGALTIPGLAKRLELMRDSGVLSAILPELYDAAPRAVLRARALERLTCAGLPDEYAGYLDRTAPLVALALFGAQENTDGRQMLRRLRRPRAQIKSLEALRSGAARIGDADRLTLRTLAFELGIDALGAALVASCDAHNPLDLLSAMLRELPIGLDLARHPLLSGHDLVQLGAQPGPGLGELLQRLDTERLADPSIERNRALELARDWITA